MLPNSTTSRRSCFKPITRSCCARPSSSGSWHICLETAKAWHDSWLENWASSWLHSARACNGLSQNASKPCRS